MGPALASCAIVTVVTGLQAGRTLGIDAAPVLIGTAGDSDLVVQEAGVSPHHLRLARTSLGTFYAEDLGSASGTFRRNGRIGVALLQEGDVLQLGSHLQLRFALVEPPGGSLAPSPREPLVLDAIPLLFDRLYLDERLVAEIAHTRRVAGDLAVLAVGVDHLDDVTSRFGQLAGDRALSTVAARISRVLGPEDVMARYGVDQLVVLAVGTGVNEATQLAERVRRAVDGLHMSARGREVHLTTSIGVGSLSELEESDDPASALLALANVRLGGATASGRNRVSAVSPSSTQH
ncbi:MAG TPA: GGDEF domain-containing protein [Polyangiaceae bacterium]|jgi:diguanylate cyclase (GGDEF)-like protein